MFWIDVVSLAYLVFSCFYLVFNVKRAEPGVETQTVEIDD